ncbi:hypothetical protein BC829DRAFT_369338 [Chytridium lagenaria]|nr:hypothetical protein BC829DRAFT_369338 [Chytridium lagenaria]
MSEPEKAMAAYDSALRHNPSSVQALTRIAALCRAREQYYRAVEYFQRIVAIDPSNGEIWGALGHCCLMIDDLQKAYHAYQQALYHLPNPKEPKLWYGIGILYDRYGSFEHAEEAFSAVIRMEPKFDKANEIYFRLGIIYKQQGKYDLSLSCFKYILSCPPKPLTEVDIWFQIGHVYEQQKEYHLARDAYERVLAENPSHAKVLQQLGWLYHQASSFSNQELAISFLTRSLEADSADSQTWHILGRCYMAQQKYPKAYEAYQQAVTKDGKNPIFWKDIGVLYFQINQYHDALDAYLRAIYLNPIFRKFGEYNLGTLYENCNNQISDAIDAYSKALDLEPYHTHIKQRLQMLRQQQATGQPPSGPPLQPYQPAPHDPTTYNPSSNGGAPLPAASQYFTGPQPPSGMPGPGFARPPSQEIRPVGRPPEFQDRKEPPPFPEQLGGPPPGSNQPLPPFSQPEHHALALQQQQAPPRPSSGGRGSPKVLADPRQTPSSKPPARRMSPGPGDAGYSNAQGSAGSAGYAPGYDGHHDRRSPNPYPNAEYRVHGTPQAQVSGQYSYQSAGASGHGTPQQINRSADMQRTVPQEPSQARTPHILPRGGELMDIDVSNNYAKRTPDGESVTSTPKEGKSAKGKHSRKSNSGTQGGSGGKGGKKTPALAQAVLPAQQVPPPAPQSSYESEMVVAAPEKAPVIKTDPVRSLGGTESLNSPRPVGTAQWATTSVTVESRPVVAAINAGPIAISQTIRSVDDNYDEEVTPAPAPPRSPPQPQHPVVTPVVAMPAPVPVPMSAPVLAPVAPPAPVPAPVHVLTPAPLSVSVSIPVPAPVPVPVPASASAPMPVPVAVSFPFPFPHHPILSPVSVKTWKKRLLRRAEESLFRKGFQLRDPNLMVRR